MCGFVPFHHDVCTGLSHKEGTGEVHGEGGFDVFVGGRQEGLVSHHAGGIDVDVDGAEVGFDARNGGRDFGARGNIGAVVFNFDAVVITQSVEGG